VLLSSTSSQAFTSGSGPHVATGCSAFWWTSWSKIMSPASVATRVRLTGAGVCVFSVKRERSASITDSGAPCSASCSQTPRACNSTCWSAFSLSRLTSMWTLAKGPEWVKRSAMRSVLMRPEVPAASGGKRRP
jgi:hypothetical protein